MAPCSIKWCGKNSKTSNFKTDGITFHRYPKDAVLKEKWIEATRRENWFPSEYSTICSRHFTQDCFVKLKNRRRLLRSAVPSRLLPLLSHETNILNGESSLVDQTQERDNSRSLERTEIAESEKREFMRKIQRQTKKIKRLEYLNRCLKKKITALEEALENATNKLE